MKHTLLIALAALTATGSALGSPLSPEAALQRVQSSSSRHIRSLTVSSAEPIYTLSDSNSLPALYVFSTGEERGFMIVSADSAALPLLGYSDSEIFDPANLPPQMKWWLEGYGKEITALRAMEYSEAPAGQVPDLPKMEAVGPLLKSKWNQGAPYNKYCYTLEADGDSTQSVTGCVATAMAQVMYYFQQPETGQGEISYRHGDSGTYSMNFASVKFNWKDMMPTYYAGTYNEEEGEAVALLMKACGYSVKMDYGKGEAGASGANIPGALINYFGYKGGIRLETRKFWTYTEWAQMIHRNLMEVGPVVYDGDALDGGHSFVCDGYDGNGYFHINWGWGGMADGYYLLDALNPDEYGIGGAAGGYNLGQQVILGITPADTDIFATHIMQIGNTSGKIDGSTLSMELTGGSVGFQYIDPQEITVTFGIMVENVTDSSQTVQYFESDKKNLSVKQSDSFRWDEVGRTLDLNNVTMTEGDQYDFIMATLITTPSGSQWVETVPMVGHSNRVSVVKNDGKYAITNYNAADMEVSDFKVMSDPVYWNMPVKFEATFTNNSDTELTRNYSGEFFNSEGTKCFTMENFSVTLSPNTSQTIEWTSVDWYKEEGAEDITSATDFSLKLSDNWQGNYVDIAALDVTVDPTPATPEVEATLSVDNATELNDIYIVDGDQAEVSVSLSVKKGLFNKPILLEVQAPNDKGEYFTVQHERFGTIPYLSEGESQTLSMTIAISDVEVGKTYRLEATGSGIKQAKPVLVKFNIKADGVERLADEQPDTFTVYNLQGMKVLETQDSSRLSGLPAGLYIINGKKLIVR